MWPGALFFTGLTNLYDVSALRNEHWFVWNASAAAWIEVFAAGLSISGTDLCPYLMAPCCTRSEHTLIISPDAETSHKHYMHVTLTLYKFSGQLIEKSDHSCGVHLIYVIRWKLQNLVHWVLATFAKPHSYASTACHLRITVTCFSAL